MRWIAGLMLGGAAMLGGCLQPGAVFCENGAVCREGQACTEDVTSLCDTEHAVAQCYGAGRSDGMTCSTQEGGAGLCTGGACVPCAPELLECRVSTWTPMQSMATEDLKAIHVAGPRLAYVVGSESTVLRYDGVSWTRIEGPRESLQALPLVGVWSSASELFVLGGDIYQQAASGWTKTTPSAGTFLLALFGTSSTSLFAAGNRGRLGLYNGTSWNWVDDPAGTLLMPTPPYNALWGTSASDVIAVGNDGLISHHDGSNAWSEVTMPALDGISFFAVHGASGKVFATGRTASGQLAVAEMTSTRTWEPRSISSTANGTLFGLAVVDANEAYAVGSDGLVLRYDGSTWSEVPTIGTEHDLFAAAVIGRTIFAVGAGGTIWRYDLP